MLRAITYLLITIFLITVIRSIIGVVLRGFSDLLRTSPAPAAARPSPSVPLTGELKKDPVCGTYTAVSSSVQQTFRGETLYFCSTGCRDKYVASQAAKTPA